MLSLILFMSIVSFIVMGWDKYRAMTGGWRVSNTTHYVITFFFGSPGTIIAMLIFRHKIRSNAYKVSVLAGLLLNLFFTGFLWHIIWFFQLLVAVFTISLLSYLPICISSKGTNYQPISPRIKYIRVENKEVTSLIDDDWRWELNLQIIACEARVKRFEINHKFSSHFNESNN